MVFSSLNQSLQLVGSGFNDNNRYASIPIPKMETAKNNRKTSGGTKASTADNDHTFKDNAGKDGY